MENNNGGGSSPGSSPGGRRRASTSMWGGLLTKTLTSQTKRLGSTFQNPIRRVMTPPPAATPPGRRRSASVVASSVSSSAAQRSSAPAEGKILLSQIVSLGSSSDLLRSLRRNEPVEDIKAKLLLCYCVITSNSLQLFGFKTETEEKADLAAAAPKSLLKIVPFDGVHGISLPYRVRRSELQDCADEVAVRTSEMVIHLGSRQKDVWLWCIDNEERASLLESLSTAIYEFRKINGTLEAGLNNNDIYDELGIDQLSMEEVTERIVLGVRREHDNTRVVRVSSSSPVSGVDKAGSTLKARSPALSIDPVRSSLTLQDIHRVMTPTSNRVVQQVQPEIAKALDDNEKTLNLLGDNLKELEAWAASGPNPRKQQGGSVTISMEHFLNNGAAPAAPAAPVKITPQRLSRSRTDAFLDRFQVFLKRGANVVKVDSVTGLRAEATLYVRVTESAGYGSRHYLMYTTQSPGRLKAETAGGVETSNELLGVIFLDEIANVMPEPTSEARFVVEGHVDCWGTFEVVTGKKKDLWVARKNMVNGILLLQQRFVEVQEKKSAPLEPPSPPSTFAGTNCPARIDIVNTPGDERAKGPYFPVVLRGAGTDSPGYQLKNGCPIFKNQVRPSPAVLSKEAAKDGSLGWVIGVNGVPIYGIFGDSLEPPSHGWASFASEKSSPPPSELVVVYDSSGGEDFITI